MLKLNATTLCAWAGRLIVVGLCSVVFSNVKESGTPGERDARDPAAIQTVTGECVVAGRCPLCGRSDAVLRSRVAYLSQDECDEAFDLHRPRGPGMGRNRLDP